MKSGLTIDELTAEVLRQNLTKEDYLVKTGNLRMESFGGHPFLHLMNDNGVDEVEPLEIRDTAHRQISSYLDIPSRYYNRMLTESPALLTHNVNSWLERKKELRVVRILDGAARALVSNRYRRIDHLDILQAVLPIIGTMPDIRFESCEITEARMYIKIVNPRLQVDVTPGDTVQSGLIISNSEVGLGSVLVQPLVYRLVCSNGMVVNDAKTRRHHVGRATTTEDDFLLYSPETLQAEDRAFVLKLQDTVRAVVDETRFSRVIDHMRQAKLTPLPTEDVPGVIKLTGSSFGIREAEQPGVMQHLIEGQDMSLYGLANAITRYSQDVESYDRATELEGIGYDVLTMPLAKWNRINQNVRLQMAA
ncbi:MAG: DUF932 domain-containing protein [Dysosmobacter sp.]|nr:DUF932 domain-containing protein [Dysosmobacter sp.]